MMGGGMLDDWELTPSTNNVLLGKAGNGKSATGNSILGREAFMSDFSLSGITNTCELQSTTLKDGRTINVIDTPGLFDFSNGSDGKVIVNCISLAKEGIHAVLMVFSVTTRFTREEEAAIQSMKSLFGDRILDYMIIGFTGGDALEARGKTLMDFISHGPEPVKDLLQSCKNRVMLFNNITRDMTKRSKQLNQLLSLVDTVAADNGGKPFTDEIFEVLKKGAEKLENKTREIEAMEGYSEQQISELKEQLHKSHEEQIRQVIEMIERKLDEAIKRLEKQLAEEQAARLKAEKGAQAARMKSEKEISQLREQLRRAQEENQEFRKRAESLKCRFL